MSRLGLELFQANMLHFPLASAPLLTIVISVYRGPVNFTQNGHHEAGGDGKSILKPEAVVLSDEVCQ